MMMKQRPPASRSNKTSAAARSTLMATRSVSFHDEANLARVHVFGDMVDEEGCCHIESRKLLWWTPEEEREIARAYEAVVYLMETGKHTAEHEDDENDDQCLVDSSRGLEKRTEDGAWKLYETQRDFRNVVLGEQDRWKGQQRQKRGADVDSMAVHLAQACQDLSAAALDCARQMAAKDAQAVVAYLRCESNVHNNNNKASSLSPRRRRSSKMVDGACDNGKTTPKTSPLKSPASKRVVPWVRHMSMPLTDTIEIKALKASVEDQPIEKEAMALAAKSVLDSRCQGLVTSSSSTAAGDDDSNIVVPKKKKKKTSTKKAAAATGSTSNDEGKVKAKKVKKTDSTAEDDDDTVVKKVKKIKKKTKQHATTTNDQEDATSATRDTTTDYLEDEIRSLEEEAVANKKEVAKKESEKLRLLAKKMSFGFDEAAATKVEKKKKSSKEEAAASSSSSTATLQDAPAVVAMKQPSVKKTKISSKRKMKKVLGSSLSDLNYVSSSDLSSAPHILESSTSSFEYDDDEEIVIKEATTANDGRFDAAVMRQQHQRKQLSSLFPRAFRKKLAGSSIRKKLDQQPNQAQEASCHF